MRDIAAIATIAAGAALAVPLTLAAPARAAPSREHAPLPLVPLPLVPMPQSVIRGDGSFTVTDGAAIAASDAGTVAAARLLADHVRTERGLRLAVGDAGAIRIVRDAAVAGDEAYRLVVDRRGITIAASGDRGLVHGAMTLAQLLSPDSATGRPVAVPALTIADAPRFAWRGLMIDPARHFLPMPALRAIVDQMASVKLNTLHLHLTDDQGWRVEIRKYPRLTDIGAWRVPPSSGGPAPAERVGGSYTQAELKDLVAYASARGIAIVPEIDLPGHAQALVAAYPELGILGDTPAVSNQWGIMPYLFNPGPKGLAFVEDVLDELMAIFPGTYIHLGGDEAVKDQWQRSPVVQAQIKALGLKDEDALQSWMIERFGRYLQAKGRRLIGWDEILEGGLPASASVMSWRGEQGAVAAANMGHDVVLTPGLPLYLNNLQSTRSDEPPGRFDAIVTLEKVYAYDPMPAGIAADRAHHVLGAQGNLWSEYIVTPRQLQHLAFPRAGALAEIAWSPAGTRDFPGFLARLRPQMARWRASGMAVADSAFAVDFAIAGSRGDALRAGRTTVALSTQAGYGTIRYTLDGRDPGPRAPVYRAPLRVATGTTIRAAAFVDGTATAAPRAFATDRASLLARGTSDLVACPGGTIGLRVPPTADATADAPVYNVDIFDTCTVYPAAPLDIATGFTIDVARLPRPYALAHDFTKVRRYFNVTPYGELAITAGCATDDKTRTPVIATFPLPDPASAPTRFRFAGTLPRMAGDTDLCLRFTAPIDGPYYAIDRVQLTGAGQ